MISQRQEIIDGYYGTRTDVNNLIKVNKKRVLRDTCYKEKKKKKRKKEKKTKKAWTAAFKKRFRRTRN